MEKWKLVKNKANSISGKQLLNTFLFLMKEQGSELMNNMQTLLSLVIETS